MVGLHGHQTRHLRLIVLLVFLCLAAGLVQRITLSPRSSSPPLHRERVQRHLNPPDPPAPPPNRIHGRWEAVRASLSLPPLPHEAALTFGADPALTSRRDARQPSRFDPGRMRQAAEATLKRQQLPPLHFAPDTRRLIPARHPDTLRRSDKESRHPPHRPDQSMQT